MNAEIAAQTPDASQDEHWARAIAAQRAGHALTREFYCDAELFEREKRRLLQRHWHCAGHASQLPEVGDFITTEICGESILIVRGADREVRALLNVCRHRGSRVCTERTGRARGGGFVCPYHAWSYALDGSLRAAARMPAGFERADYGLQAFARTRDRRSDLRLLCSGSPRLAAVEQVLAGSARAYGWADATVAHRETYAIAANWKLAVENYMECYHCAPAHEEYSRFHLYARPAAQNTQADERVRQRTRHWASRSARPTTGVPTPAPGRRQPPVCVPRSRRVRSVAVRTARRWRP